MCLEIRRPTARRLLFDSFKESVCKCRLLQPLAILKLYNSHTLSVNVARSLVRRGPTRSNTFEDGINDADGVRDTRKRIVISNAFTQYQRLVARGVNPISREVITKVKATEVTSYLQIPPSRSKEFWTKWKIQHIRQLAQ